MSRRRVMMLLLSLPAYVRSFIERVSLDGGTLDNQIGLEDADENSALTMLPNAYKDGVLYSVLPEDGTGDFDVVRGSNATRVNAEGLIESVATNIPMIDYSTGEGVILTEPQSTNLITQSEGLSASGGGVVTLNNSISPDGTQNASKVFFNTGTNDGANIDIGGSSATPSTDYTLSFYAKNHTGDGTFRARLDTNSQIALVNETFTATSEWVRYTHTFTTDASASSFTSASRFRKSTNNNEILIWGAQLEALPYSTSYIPTSGAIATRLADSISGAGDVNTFNDSEGVLYFEGSVLDNTNSFEVISLSDAANSNAVAFVYRNIANQFTAVVKSGGSTSLSKTTTLSDAKTTIKAAISYKLNDFKFYINGVLILADTSGNTPIGLNSLQFADADGASNKFFGKTKDLRVYNTALSDAELITLTTI